MKRVSMCIAAAAMLTSASALAQTSPALERAGQPLRPLALQVEPQALTEIRTVEQAPPALRARLNELRGQPGAGLVHLARVSPQAIQAAGVGEELRLAVTPALTVSARGVAVETTDQGRLLWRGEVAGIDAAPPGLATLVVRGDNVTGSIRTADGRLFRLSPLGNGETAIVEMNYAAMPPDHPPAADPDNGGTPDLQRLRDIPGGGGGTLELQRLRATPTLRPEAIQAQRAEPDTGSMRLRQLSPQLRAQLIRPNQVSLLERHRIRLEILDLLRVPAIDVLVVYTNSARNASGDIESLIDLAVAETNDSFTNSNVRARLRLVGSEQITYNESSRSYPTMLGHLQGTSDGFLDTVHARRDALNADVVVLIVNQTDYCGYGYVNASATHGFVVVHWNCATGYYSFGHEIGHVLGAQHDPATSTNTTYTYGHGYRYTSASPSWRTVMSYNCSPSCPRLQYWSTPLTTHNGVAMGNATQSDNARVWNERVATVAAFR